MTDPRGGHNGGAVRDGKRDTSHYHFVADVRRRPNAMLIGRLERESIPDEQSARYLVEIRIGHREPVSGPGRSIPAVQAVYCDERGERWCYRTPPTEFDENGIAGVGLVEDVEDCIPAVIAAAPSFGSSPPAAFELDAETLRDQAREVLRDTHDLDVPEVRTDGGSEVVWLSTRKGGPRGSFQYHTDPECSTLQRTDTIFEKQRSALPEWAEECPVCSGDAPSGGSLDPQKYTKQLDDANPEDRGLSPLGERRSSGDLSGEPQTDVGSLECGYCHSTNVEVLDETLGFEVRYIDYWCDDCERPGTWEEPRSAKRRGSA